MPALEVTQTIDVGGARLAVRRRPGAGPTVVLAHGITGHGGTWAAFVDALPADWDVIAYDARGHGASGHADDYTYAALATDLADLVTALGLRRPALVGHSMGAHIVALAAAADPGSVSCVVLEDPPWHARPRPAAANRKRADAWRAELEAIAAGTVDARVEALRRLRPAWSDAERERCAEAERSLDPRVTEIVAEGSGDWRAAVRGPACAGLLVGGDPGQGAIVVPQLAEEIGALNPHLRCAFLPGAGHNVRRDRPADYARLVVGFLQRQE